MDSDKAGEGRRDFLKCMAWAGTGALFAFEGGIAGSIGLDSALAAPRAADFLGECHASHLRRAAFASPTIDATPVADAERHNLDRGQIVSDGNVLVIGI